MACVDAKLIESGIADGAGEAGLVLVHLVAGDLEDLGVRVEEATLATRGVYAVHHLKMSLMMQKISKFVR